MTTVFRWIARGSFFSPRAARAARASLGEHDACERVDSALLGIEEFRHSASLALHAELARADFAETQPFMRQPWDDATGGTAPFVRLRAAA